MPNAECNTQRKIGSAMWTCWALRNINTIIIRGVFVQKRKCPRIAARSTERVLKTTVLFSILWGKKGLCAAGIFFKRIERRDLRILNYHYHALPGVFTWDFLLNNNFLPPRVWPKFEFISPNVKSLTLPRPRDFYLTPSFSKSYWKFSFIKCEGLK